MVDYDPNTVIRGEEDRRFVEDDLTQLAEMDNTIRDMLARRENLVNRIKKANAVNTERVNTSEDWFEGDLRGRPIPARSQGMETPIESRDAVSYRGH